MFSLHPLSINSGTAAFAVCSITVAPLNRHPFHFHQLAGSVLQFLRLFSQRFRVVFSNFPCRSTDASPFLFFSHSRIFFITPLLTNPCKHPVVVDTVVANRSRLQVTNVSGPIDVGPLLFCDRSLVPSSIVKFDEKQRLHDDRKQRRADATFLYNTYYNLKKLIF